MGFNEFEFEDTFLNNIEEDDFDIMESEDDSFLDDESIKESIEEFNMSEVM